MLITGLSDFRWESSACVRTSGNSENVFEAEFCNTWKIEEMALKYLASINLKVKLARTGLVLRRKRIKKKTFNFVQLWSCPCRETWVSHAAICT